MKYSYKIINQNMKLLASALLSIVVFTILGAGVSVFGEPIVSSQGDVITTMLLTSDFEVDTSEFSTTGEIILNIKFENTDNTFHGLKRIYESPYDENGLDDPDEVYEKYQRNRIFYFFINDITETKHELDSKKFTIINNDEFIKTDYSDLQESSIVEVLDIDGLVPLTTSNIMKIETTLRLSSPEFLENHNYEIHLWTDTRTTEPQTFTLPTIQETSAPEPTPSEIIPSEDDSKEIPKWIKDIFGFYYEGTIGDEELIGALQYLIKNGIIEV